MLGKSPAMPDAGGAQSGYLIHHEGFTLLLECGGGVFSKLRQLADPTAVDAVLVTHLHADHTLDLLAFGFALETQLGSARHSRTVLWGPPGSVETLAEFDRALGMEGQIARGFEFGEYDPGEELRLGPLVVSFRSVPHFVRAWACDIRCNAGHRLTFGADCGPNDAIVEFAAGADLLMLEATEGAGPHPGGGIRGHLTAAEAGALAQHAGVSRLLLTHYSDRLDAGALQAAAEAEFGGTVEMAREGRRFLI